MTADLALTLTDVHKWYGGYHALRGITLGVGRGEKVVICGPSGSGKSTLVRCVNALERHQDGTIVVDGVTLTDDDGALAAVRRRTGMVFQRFNLFPHLSVLANLTIGLVYARGVPEQAARERAMAMLAQLRIETLAARFPGQISGGQKQRVAIARALLLDPAIMLFDEPTSALDPEMIGEVLDVMEQLAAAGTTMIVVTHEMGFARRVADLVVFMDRGEIVEAAPPAEFFAAPQTPRARTFVHQIDQNTETSP